MEIWIAAYPLRYLSLEARSGRRLIWRDLPSMMLVAAVTAVPYAVFEQANFFHKDGFIDKVGTFSSVLTGFYVAGLVAVATFPFNRAGLDKVIEVGPVFLPTPRANDDKLSSEQDDRDREALTRREYVCSMFGYLAFMSMLTTILSIMCVTIADWVGHFKPITWAVRGIDVSLTHADVRLGVVGISCLFLSSLFVTTSRALYYLIDRLYASSPEVLPLQLEGDIERNDGAEAVDTL